MKRKLLFILVTLFGIQGLSLAQQDIASHDVYSLNYNQSSARQHSPNNTINALFDLQFDYVLPRGGFAGITWTPSNFWVSKWQSDSIFIVDDSTGALLSSFTIHGIGGVRGMTFDGTSVWATNNTTFIYEIDTTTHTVVDTIIAPYGVRGITYDSAANGGAGGLWIANYSTDITLIDFNGIAQTSIAAASHGLTGMYSIAYDPWSTGGPYIWAFDFGPGGTVQNLVRILVATGIKDAIHDVGLEIGGSGIAGGLSITGFGGQPHTIIGVSQDSPDRIFGLELADYVPPLIDASADTLHFDPPYTRTPAFLVNPINWELITTQNGTNVVDTLSAALTVNDGTSNVFTAAAYVAAVPSFTSAVIAFPGTYTPAAMPGAAYTATAIVNTGSQFDQENANDTSSYSFLITDTTMGRNGETSDGRIGIGGTGGGGVIGLTFDVPITAYATSVTFSLRGPTLGDSIKAELYDFSGGTPVNMIAISANYVITVADTGGIVITLPLLNGPIQLTAGTYLAGIREYNHNVSMHYSFFNWRPNASWFFTPANGWRPLEAINFRFVPFVFLNVWSQNMVSVGEAGNTVFTMYPNPSADQFNIDFPVSGNYDVTISDIQGKIIYRNNLVGINKEAIVTSEWSDGLYIVKVISNGKSYYAKMIVGR